MRKQTILVTFLLIAFTVTPVWADHEHNHGKAVNKADARIYGEYIETRNADVYTGQCFLNSEIGLTGDQAILAWRIQQGSWHGVKLDGLNVVAVVRAAATLGSNYENPYPAKTVLILDSKATEEQQAALTAFVISTNRALFENVVKTDIAPISFAMDYHGEHAIAGRVKAGETVGISTRLPGDKDKICGHEETLFQPLTATSHVMPSVAMLDEFTGSGLGVTWMLSGKRSAFVGHFAY